MPSLNPKSYILNSNARGFIAITTSIILSLLTLAIAAVFGSSAFLTRFNNLDFYHKKTSYFLARTCLEYARLKLAENINYAGSIATNATEFFGLPVVSLGVHKIKEGSSGYEQLVAKDEKAGFYKKVIQHAFRLIAEGKEKYALREEGFKNLRFQYKL